MRGHFRKATLVLAVGSLVLASPREGRCQGEAVERHVGPHHFIGVPGVPTPFVGTFVRASTGAATTIGLEVEYYDLQDPPQLIGVKENDLKFLVQEFEFQQKLWSRAALRLSVAGSGRLGTDTATLLSEGISGIFGYSLGGSYQLSESEKFKLSIGADYASNSLTGISIGDFIKDVIANGLSDTTNSLVQTESNSRITGGIRAAWGPSTMFGYMLYGDAGAQEPYDESEDTEFFWQAGGALSLDMREKWGPDIGFALNSVYRSRSSRNEDLGSGGFSSGLTIAYTGRPNFNVGLQTTYSRLKQLEVDNRLSAFGANFFLRFDFS